MPPEQAQLLKLLSHSTNTPYTVQTEHAKHHPLIDIVLNRLLLNNIDTSITLSSRVNHVSVQLGCLITGGCCARMYLKDCTVSFAAHNVLVLEACSTAPCMLHAVPQDSRAFSSLPCPLPQPALLHCSRTCIYLDTLLHMRPATATTEKAQAAKPRNQAHEKAFFGQAGV